MWTAWLILELSAAAVLTVLLFYTYSTYHYGRWKKLGVPHTKPTPLLGHLGDTIMGRAPLLDLVMSLYQRFDGHRYFGMYEARMPMLVVRDPELAYTVMVRDFGSFCDRNADNVSFKHDKLFDHLINLRGEQWKAVRAKLSPTFSSAKLKSMLADIKDCTARLVDLLNGQIANGDEIVDISEAVAQYSTDTIGRCAFGLDCNALSEPNSKFRKTGREILTSTPKIVLLNFMNLIGIGQLVDLFRIRRLDDHIYDFFDNLLLSTMEQHESGETNRNDFVALLVKLKNEEKLKNPEQRLFTDDILVANLFVFFIAGYETTASTICYCLYELAKNQEIQDELRKKLKQTMNDNEGGLSYDALKDMKYLHMVINETFRKHPPVPILNRVCTKKYTIPGSDITMNVGEKLLIPTYAFHYDPKYYPNPEVFDPERFTEENIASRVRGTFLPFGDGPRICIGMRFALMETKIVLAEILTKFKVIPCKDTQTTIKIKPRTILLTPLEPIRLKFETIDE